MCGIFGCISDNVAFGVIKQGLVNLAYRGYDSAGIAMLSQGNILVEKVEGHPKLLADLNKSGNLAIGHNRWATHSPPTKDNSHPYVSNDKKIYLVHNGIIENYVEIKKFLEDKGFNFYSETDTEVVPNLIQYYLSQGNSLQISMRNTAKQIEGAFGIIFIHTDYPEQLNIMKLGSPIYVGKSEGSIYVCSDAYSFTSDVKTYSSIGDNKIAVIYKNDIELRDLEGKELSLVFKQKEQEENLYSLGEYKDYMSKEIHEQVGYSRSSIAGRVKEGNIKLGGIDECVSSIIKARQIIFTGCGSAYNASCVGSLAMEEIGGIISKHVSSGELKYYNSRAEPSDWLVAVSQSGETADVIGCIKNMSNLGLKILGVVNTPNSTIYKMTDCGIHIRAGKEVSVASTKAVTNQIISMLLLAYKIGLLNNISYKEYKDFTTEIEQLPNFIEAILQNEKQIQEICEIYKDSKTSFVVGRNILEFIAKEIALKIKEISYIHSEGYSGSELKHGPLALIDNKIMNICLLDKHTNPEKTISNIEEVKARNGRVVLITNYSVSEVENKIYDNIISIETGTNKFITAILFNIIGQIMSYHLAVLNNRNVDLPRNLAKSVTVE